MKRIVNWFKPYSVDAYERGEAIPFGTHNTWTKAGALAWVACYPDWCDVVVWRAASFGRLPVVDAERRSV